MGGRHGISATESDRVERCAPPRANRLLASGQPQAATPDESPPYQATDRPTRRLTARPKHVDALMQRCSSCRHLCSSTAMRPVRPTGRVRTECGCLCAYGSTVGSGGSGSSFWRASS